MVVVPHHTMQIPTGAADAATVPLGHAGDGGHGAEDQQEDAAEELSLVELCRLKL